MHFFQIIFVKLIFMLFLIKKFGKSLKFNFGIGFWYLIFDILTNNLEFYEFECENNDV